MKVKLILPALTEAKSSFRRPIKYCLFPPLGLATLAAYLGDDDGVELCHEQIDPLDLNDEPDLVGIEVYIASAYRAYEIADHYRRKGAHVALGGLHVTSMPDEAAKHADTIFVGPGDDSWPRFLEDFRAGTPGRLYRSTVRQLAGTPRPRRDLIKTHKYLVPNSVVVSRGCPHSCDFCYKQGFFAGGKSFYTRLVDEALDEIDSLAGRHLYFLDDNLFADTRFVTALTDGMRGMGRVWQAAGTVQSILQPGLMESAAESGLRSLFVGFESINGANLASYGKHQNRRGDYEEAITRLHELGVMINASFVFGMDDDDPSVFDRTVEWAVSQGIETATFHILTPYPGTALHARLSEEGRITSNNWSLYDTRHTVFQPARMTVHELEDGYHRAYREFYRWRSILSAAWTKDGRGEKLRHVAYAGGWKKFEGVWGLLIKTGVLAKARPVLERVLGGKRLGGSPSASLRTGLALPKPIFPPRPARPGCEESA